MRGPSTAFIDAALAGGRRRRRRRRVSAAAGVLLACAAIVLPWTIISGQAHTPPAATPASGRMMSRLELANLPGGWVVTGAGALVLDRASGSYVSVKSDGRVLPAPLGDRVLIESSPETLVVTGVRGTQPVTLDTTGLGSDYQWSPGGDRLVGTANQKEPFKIGFTIIDARTGAATTHWDPSNYDCSQCSFGWTRDGREVVMAIADRSGGEGAEYVTRLQLFDAETGAPTRSLPIKAMPSGPFSWSPNGRYVIANPNVLANHWQLIDVATGQSRPFPYDAVWVSDDQLLAAEALTVFALSPDDTVTATGEAEIPGAGHVGDPISFGPPA